MRASPVRASPPVRTIRYPPARGKLPPGLSFPPWRDFFLFPRQNSVRRRRDELAIIFLLLGLQMEDHPCCHVQMDGDAFLTDILLDGDNGVVPGLEDLNIPSTQNNQSSQEVEQTDVEVQASRSSKGSKRTKNFSADEDEVICSGWLNISKDPINGANQTRTSFWKRVHNFFEKHKKTTAARTESSIMHRWLAIQASVNKFCACYDAIEGRNQSGTTVKDMISEALKMYERVDKDKKSFTLIPCWKRPEGIKKAKEAARRGGGEASMEALDKMWAKKEAFDKEKEKAKEERFMASLEVEKAALELEKKRVENKAALEEKKVALEEKRCALEEKKAEADLLKEENAIMFVDKRTLDPLQLQYIEMMQKKIIARRMEN